MKFHSKSQQECFATSKTDSKMYGITKYLQFLHSWGGGGEHKVLGLVLPNIKTYETARYYCFKK